jgi:formylmethanofuran dehydrogenase subunit A
MFIDEIVKQTAININKDWVCDYAGENIKGGQIILHIKDGKIVKKEAKQTIE